ncbi:MAG: diphthine synthase [Nanoarchaeota archaeon]|nr:diphthine synthase [Nanoarchaeota archaeon]
MLYLISMGLHDEKDMSTRAVTAAKTCAKLYVEFYTMKMNTNAEQLTRFLGRPVLEVTRSDLEEKSGKILSEAFKANIGILVGGDALCATTHASLVLEARRQGITVHTIHGSSIFSAIGETGLQPYKFGRTVTLAYGEEGYVPVSFYDVIRQNKNRGMHTLVLLDIKKEANRYMTVPDAIAILLDAEKAKRAGLFTNDTKIVGAADLGGNPVIRYGTLSEVRADTELGMRTPAVLVVPGELHFFEEEFLETFRKKRSRAL